MTRGGEWYHNQYLNSEHWRAFRIGYFNRFGTVTCAVCDRNNQIQLHHNTYVRVGREDHSDITPLCLTCHGEVHKWLDARKLPVEATAAAITSLKTCIKPFVFKPKKKKKGRKTRTAKQRRRIAYEQGLRQANN